MNEKRKKYSVAVIAAIVLCVIAATGNGGSNKESSKSITMTTVVDIESQVTEYREAVTETATKEYSTSSTLTESNEQTTGIPKTDNSKHNFFDSIPKYDGKAYTVVNDNEPTFRKKEITEKSFEEYAPLDSLGRCGTVMACIGKNIMPTKERGAIGQVKPTGWHTVKYDCVDGKYLYNRCHLIGYQLTGENANERNLITGTRYLNVEGMLPFEDMVADYVKETNYHVMYRVIPRYKGNNLLASGVEMEAYSVEDQGEGISFHVYCYNVQPGIKINYTNGNSSEKNVTEAETESTNNLPNDTNATTTQYILNLSSHKFHYPDCYSVAQMNPENKGIFTGNRQDLIDQGYTPCGNCNP